MVVNFILRNWVCDTVTVFPGVEKYCDFSSRFTALSNLLVLCLHDKGLVVILLSGDVAFPPVVPFTLGLSDRCGTTNVVFGYG